MQADGRNEQKDPSGERRPERRKEQGAEPFGPGLGRAFAGAILFALPMMMTMEMWWLGFSMDRLRLALLLVLLFPLLVGISYLAGFRETSDLRADAVDALVAYAVGFVAPTAVLLLFNVLDLRGSLDEAVGQVAVQAVPGSMGALLARSQFGNEGGAEERTHPGYAGELLLMVVGALFLSLNIAPTEEVLLLAYRMTDWHAAALALASLAIIHAFVYSVGFRGQADIPEGTPRWSVFFRFTVVGYALVLGVALYVLWTFGRTTGVSPAEVVTMAVVLGFPASVGAAAARLIL